MILKRFALRIGILVLVIAGLVLLVPYVPWKTAATAAGSDVWTCSMHPQIRLPNPGRCPICGMALIPVSQLTAANAKEARHAEVETEPVTFRELFKEIRTVGKLDYNERRVAYIPARIAGRIDRVYADFTGMSVKPGDHLVEIYSPDLNVAQRELLLALEASERERKTPPAAAPGLAESRLEAVRTKLRLLGILPEQIAEIEKSRKTTTDLTIFAPIGGTVIEKDVRLGQYVNAGDQLYRIADLDALWLFLSIYEFDLGWVRFGEQVEVTVEAFPGETFRGMVTFIDPFVDDATRAVRVRVNLPNPDRRLKPQMYAAATIRVGVRSDGTPEPTGLEGKYVCPMHPEIIQDTPGKCSLCGMQLERVPGEPFAKAARKAVPGKPAPAGGPTGKVLAIPVSAVLTTGRRQIAYRAAARGGYELVELQLGPRAQAGEKTGSQRDFHPVLAGLKDGDRVVVRSGFLLDSQRQIEGQPSLLYPEGQSSPAQLHSGHGMAMPAAKPGSSMPAETKPHAH